VTCVVGRCRWATWRIQSVICSCLVRPASTRCCTDGSTTTSDASSSRRCAAVPRRGPAPARPALRRWQVPVPTAPGQWPSLVSRPPDRPDDAGEHRRRRTMTILNWNRANVTLEKTKSWPTTPTSSRYSSASDRQSPPVDRALIGTVAILHRVSKKLCKIVFAITLSNFYQL